MHQVISIEISAGSAESRDSSAKRSGHDFSNPVNLGHYRLELSVDRQKMSSANSLPNVSSLCSTLAAFCVVRRAVSVFAPSSAFSAEAPNVHLLSFGLALLLSGRPVWNIFPEWLSESGDAL